MGPARPRNDTPGRGPLEGPESGAGQLHFTRIPFVFPPKSPKIGAPRVIFTRVSFVFPSKSPKIGAPRVILLGFPMYFHQNHLIPALRGWFLLGFPLYLLTIAEFCAPLEIFTRICSAFAWSRRLWGIPLKVKNHCSPPFTYDFE